MNRSPLIFLFEVDQVRGLSPSRSSLLTFSTSHVFWPPQLTSHQLFQLCHAAAPLVVPLSAHSTQLLVPLWTKSQCQLLVPLLAQVPAARAPLAQVPAAHAFLLLSI